MQLLVICSPAAGFESYVEQRQAMPEGKRSCGRLAVTLALLASSSCVQAKPSDAGLGSAERLADAIVLREKSNVCVSLRIDPRLRLRPPTPDADHDSSMVFAGALDQLHEETGTSFLPGPRQHPRIVTNDRGTNPLCERDADDIHIHAAYLLRDDGTPFRFTYRIEQGQATLSGSAERDIEGEWRTGKRVKLGYAPLDDAIRDDLPERVRSIYSLIKRE